MFDVVTFGSATIDLFVETERERGLTLHTSQGEEKLIAYPTGEKILIKEPHIDIGGGGTNTATAFRRFGLRTAYCGCLGEDEHGNNVVDWLGHEGIDFVGTRTHVSTNMSIVLDSTRLADRTILVYKGSSDELSFADLDLASVRATWWYFPSMVGKSFWTMIELMRYARAHDIALAFNPSIYQAQLGFDALKEPLTSAQVVIMNKEEAEALVGKSDSCAELCRRLRQSGCEIVLITDGSRGATLLYADTLYSAAPRTDVTVVETTGAGDCFASSFLAGLIQGLSAEESLRLAFVNAESLISHIGPKNGLLSFDEARLLVESDTREVVKNNI